MQNDKKIKFIISISILLIVTLLITSITLSIFILKKQNEIKKQEAEIEKLNNQIEYYEKQNGLNILSLIDFNEVNLW